jgi:hypothetical protein
MSPLRTNGLCSFPGCGELATVDYLHCDACLGSLCPKHIYHQSIDHPCPTFNLPALQGGKKWSREAGQVKRNRLGGLVGSSPQCELTFQFYRLETLIRLNARFAAKDLRGVDCKPAFVPNMPSIAEWLPWCGSYHLNVPLNFDDGVDWLIRIRWDLSTPSGGAKFALTSSDVATTITAHELSPRFVPQVFLPPDENRRFI